ncbi:MAG TPA: hypothetical protein VFA98_04850 [Thermoanaerobaculia bacterium]|jgi:broad specificity phosphatase PhoE|nr:hypothetical protein [Thermoanaerobaculia bacterium]
MKPCWHDLGLTEEGARIADALVGELTELLKKCPPEIEASLLTEARFRARELPKKTLDYRKRYEKDNGIHERNR